jgi:hypothetical protein
MDHLVIKRPDFNMAKDCLNALRKLELKYLLIQNFFSNDELNSIFRDLNAIPSSLFTTPIPGYRIFPRVAFNPTNREENMDIYFATSAEGTNNLKRFVSVDVARRFNEVFNEVGNSPSVSVMVGPGNDTKFIPANFRFMTPETGAKGTSHIHKDSNITIHYLNSVYRHLKGLMDFDNQLSFFCLIQNCTEGGDLTIYDFKHDQDPALTDNSYFNLPENKAEIETNRKKSVIRMNPGDLIIFNGGQLWHKVEVVKKGERITLGGFVASRYDDNIWHYWV